MKKIVILLSIVIILGVGGIFYYNYREAKKQEELIRNAKIEISTIDNLDIEFLTKLKVSDLITSINGKIVDDYVIDTKKVGKKTVDFIFINDDNIRLNYSIDINIVDTVPPLIWNASTYTVVKGKEFDYSNVLCGDNYDSKPECSVIGYYDTNKIGFYKLEFKAVDSSGNETTSPFTLNVVESIAPSKPTNNEIVYKDYSDIVKTYKTDKTKIGIDVSSWQGEIDFAALKNAGVEFVIIRVGGNTGTEKENFVDKTFYYNIEEANKYGIDVGLYFFSYANSKEHAIRDAKWVLDVIKDYDVSLPIAFDWENWNYFNSYNLSFYELTEMANSFLDTLSKEGYKGMVYGSKNYLENMWLEVDYPIWVAQYNSSLSYKGDYLLWQICENGKVDGIKGAVDVDILYLQDES